MATDEVNPIRGGNSSLDAASSLSGGYLNPSHDVFGQPLHKVPTALGEYEHPHLKSDSDSDANGVAQTNALTGLPQQNSKPAAVYGDEFESGIPPIDYAAHLTGKAIGAVDKAVESGASVVKQATQAAVTQIAETVHQSIDTAQKHWNAPDNELRTTVNQRFNQTIELIKQKVSNLSAHPDVKEAMNAATELGRTVAAKTGNLIETAQSATETWVSRAFDSSYLDRSLTPKSVSSYHSARSLDQPFVGVIDTSFQAQSHGAEVVRAIQQSSQRFPDWLAASVGTGHWAESLVQFVDAAKASGHSGAIVNLSFDLTQINPDGSVTTRLELTDAERAALIYAHDNGVLIVASAGNRGGAISALGAAQAFDNIITVGATEGNDRASYSSYGKGLDLVAAGHNPISALTGTSLAAAEVTGTIAKLWAKEPQLTARQVIHILHSTAKDLNAPGWDAETGFGLLDRSAAIERAESTPIEVRRFSRFQAIQNPNHENASDSTWSSVSGAIPSEQPNSVSTSTTTAESSSQLSSSSVTVESGDTLWEIAERELGEGNRWTELRQADGSTFTEQEARQLQIGTEVYFSDTDRSPDNSNPLTEQPYVVEPGDTLWEIAQSQLGDGNRWQELQKADGNSFTEQEAQQLQIGTSVFLPENNSTQSTASNSEWLLEYSARPGDTLQSIAAQLLNNGDRWTELRTVDDKPFTAESAKQFQPGTLVYVAQTDAPVELQEILQKINAIPDEVTSTMIGIGIGDKVVRWALKRDIVQQVRGSEKALRQLEQLQQELPGVFAKKAVALTSKGTLTYSGWIKGSRFTKTELSSLETMAKQNGLKLVHPKPDLPEVKELSHKTGYQPEVAKPAFLDRGQPGQYQYSHAEKQAFSSPRKLDIPQRAVAVSKPICGDEGRCGEFTQRLAGTRKTTHVLAAAADPKDPNSKTTIHVARSDYQVDKLEPGMSRKDLSEEAKRITQETFTEQPGLSQPIAKALDNPVVGKAVKAFKPVGFIADGVELYGAYDTNKSFGDNLKDENLQETAGSVAGGWGGAAAGAAAGAAIGSIVPGVGTVAGGIIGGIAGGLAGSSGGPAIVKGLRSLFG